MDINEIVIIGGGPVGSFLAVLFSKFRLPVTVYEKRHNFTRAINVKIKKNFFLQAQDVCDRLGSASLFFQELNTELNNQHRKILLKTLEERLKYEAAAKGAMYIKAEIKTFSEVYEQHKDSSPLILDCTGRNSPLRTSTFGEDVTNMKEMYLDSLLYINFTADIISDDISLYPAMKNVNHIKLARLLSCKQENSDTRVTIVACITQALATLFDNHYPDINKTPLKPFCECVRIPREIFQTIAALLGPLMLQGNRIRLDSVEVKKINMTCGFAEQRSQGRLVCLGDAAVHLAFFQSLNIGLKHALIFFSMVVNFCKTHGVVTDPTILLKLSYYHPEYRDDYIIEQFKKRNPSLNPVRVMKTKKQNVFMVVTKVVWFGCYSYDVKHSITRQLTSMLGVYEHKIVDELDKLNRVLELEVSQTENKERIMQQFIKDVDILKIGAVSTPVDVDVTIRRDNYMITTKSMRYGCFRYDIATHYIERLTDMTGIDKSQIDVELVNLNEKLRNWPATLGQFEAIRQTDIQSEIDTNAMTQFRHDFAADAVSINGKVGIKLYEVFSHVHRGYAIYPSDIVFFARCLEVVQNLPASSSNTSECEVSKLAAVQELALLGERYHKHDILTDIRSYPLPQFFTARHIIRTRRQFPKGSLLQNEVKLDFVLSCIAHII